MTSLVLDTHALVWYIVEPQKLSANAINVLDSMNNEEDIIYISAISLIEINYLIEKERLPRIVLERIVEAINYADSALVVASVDFNVANAIEQINRLEVPDMPDRIIAATALYLSLPLITRDRKIRSLNNIQTIW
jgi:PIN domain nuclease of toxin-antitoxin system